MNTFLDMVAGDLLRRYGRDLRGLRVVFPGRRARLFLDAALARAAGGAVWAPRYMSVSELMRGAGRWQVADRVRLVCELHRSYVAVTGSTEGLDGFYGWGDVLLSDFDDIDKQMADARKVFRLVGDVHELDSSDYLSPDQRRALGRFFDCFSEGHDSELRRRFLRLWNCLGDIYADYRERLARQGIAYEGMLYRDVVEHLAAHAPLQAPSSSPERGSVGGSIPPLGGNEGGLEGLYVFVGFNALTAVEERLLGFLKQEGRALVYDEAQPPQAPSSSPERGSVGGGIPPLGGNEGGVGLTFLSSPTEDLQARYVAKWLTPERIAAGARTAIVLADEGLLETVLHCLPEGVRHANVSMGFPLSESPAAGIVRLALAMLVRGRYTLRALGGILRHPYARYVSPQAAGLYNRLKAGGIYYPTLDDLAADDGLRRLFTPLGEGAGCRELNSRLQWLVKRIALTAEGDFEGESLFRMHAVLNRLAALPLEEWDFALYGRLLQQITGLTTVPFHGEPLEGIQIMGILETRNLDFDHLLILSCNDSNLPGKVAACASFIPHSVRKAYGLTTIDDRVAIYAYYFRRLLRRANDVQVLYCNSASDGRSGEMSRFMLGLLAEGGQHIRQAALAPLQAPQAPLTPPERGDAAAHAAAHTPPLGGAGGGLRRTFSPSALARYLRCPMSFYLRYVEGIDDSVEGDEEEMDHVAFGNIFHAAAEEIYKPLTGRTVTRGFIEGLLEEKGRVTIKRAVDKAFRDKLFNMENSPRPTPRLGGLHVINREMVVSFLVNLLKYDWEYAPFLLKGVETEVADDICVDTIHGPQTITVGGIIDRMEVITDSVSKAQWLRITDYKTGHYSPLNIPAFDDIFSPEGIKHHSAYYLQAIMYSLIMAKQSSLPAAPALIYVQQLSTKDYSPQLHIGGEPINDVAKYAQPWQQHLKALIEEILSPDVPFTPTNDATRCHSCSYRQICDMRKIASGFSNP